MDIVGRGQGAVEIQLPVRNLADVAQIIDVGDLECPVAHRRHPQGTGDLERPLERRTGQVICFPVNDLETRAIRRDEVDLQRGPVVAELHIDGQLDILDLDGLDDGLRVGDGEIIDRSEVDRATIVADMLFVVGPGRRERAVRGYRRSACHVGPDLGHAHRRKGIHHPETIVVMQRMAAPVEGFDAARIPDAIFVRQGRPAIGPSGQARRGREDVLDIAPAKVAVCFEHQGDDARCDRCCRRGSAEAVGVVPGRITGFAGNIGRHRSGRRRDEDAGAIVRIARGDTVTIRGGHRDRVP